MINFLWLLFFRAASLQHQNKITLETILFPLSIKHQCMYIFLLLESPLTIKDWCEHLVRVGWGLGIRTPERNNAATGGALKEALWGFLKPCQPSVHTALSFQRLLESCPNQPTNKKHGWKALQGGRGWVEAQQRSGVDGEGSGVSGAAGALRRLRPSEKGFGVLPALVSLSSFLFLDSKLWGEMEKKS